MEKIFWVFNNSKKEKIMEDFIKNFIDTIFALITTFVIVGLFHNFAFSTWSIELKMITLLMAYLLRFESRVITRLYNNK